ncbi:tyrosinase family oxidase copper chaperone [Streptomyces sp. TS71-3]|uniref:tyrosinase family oxidase copper chaperone n=1 Tax=Streptomyces sp. TS71-3 TaxID=2733862 RepID=UPI001B1DF207|nr:tyrosinase family oxidase copper chaperone [Streptomyces sp. TS71-3]GHJ39981.1 hypothetical protein Sm713_55900 [Streptomyces sp. TS71-3]
MTARSRRTLLRALFATGASAAAAAAIVPVVADARQPGPPAQGGTTDGRAPGPVHEVLFDEIYRGRHIHARQHGLLDRLTRHADGAGGHTTMASDEPMASQAPTASPAAGDQPIEVLIDGRPLHLMRRADGSYLSMVDHYGSHPTVLAAARGAVDALGASRLAPEHVY